MSAFVLARPGESSGWINLADELVKYVADKELPTVLATIERLRNADCAIRVRTITASERARIVALREAAKAPADVVAADEEAMRAGLVTIRGTSPSGTYSPELADMLSASHLSWLIAGVVRDYQYVDADKRAAFFTLAPAD